MSDVLEFSIASTSGKRRLSRASLMAAVGASMFMTPFGIAEPAQAQAAQQPNIIMIMGDDIGWSMTAMTRQTSSPARVRRSGTRSST